MTKIQNTDATISYLQGCVDTKDNELSRVKKVRNELQVRVIDLAAENARLREALTELCAAEDAFPQAKTGDRLAAAWQQARRALEVK